MSSDQEQPVEEKSTESVTGTEARTEAERRSPRRYLKLSFGLPENSYDTLKKILRAMKKLGPAGTPMTLTQIVATSAQHLRTVSGNNRFLISTGLITRSGSSFYLTDLGAQLALALDYGDTEDASRAWRSVAVETEFFRQVLDALDVRGGMTEDQFAAHIAKTAGAPNEEGYLNGARAIVEILREAGLVSQEEGSEKLVVTSDYRGLREAGEPGALSVGPSGESRSRVESPASITQPLIPVPGPSIVLNVNVSLSPGTTPEEIDALVARIKELRTKLQ